MKTTYLAASGLFLVLWLAGCASLPMDQNCRTSLDSEFEVLNDGGRVMRDHRSANFSWYLIAAADDEMIGDYEGCLNNLQMARAHNHGYAGYNNGSQASYGRDWHGQQQMGAGQSQDAAHHAAGHTHHHGH